MEIKSRNYFDFCWIIFFAGIFYISMGYNPKARLIPLIVTIPCLAMSIYRFIMGFGKGEEKGGSVEDEFVKSFMGKLEKVDKVEVEHKEKKKEKLSASVKRKRLLDIVLWTLGFVALIYIVGLLYAIPIFTFLYMRIKRESWRLSIICALGLFLGTYLAFQVGTKSTLYEGLLMELLRPE